MDISKVDSNFKIETNLKETDIRFFDITDKSNNIDVYGFHNPKETGELVRVPLEIAQKANDGVVYLHNFSAGGRVRFKTNSKYIAVKAEYSKADKMSHMPLSGSAGFDLFEKVNDKTFYITTLRPDVNIINSYEGINYFEDNLLRDIEICLPLYASVKKLYIGVQESSEMVKAEKYKFDIPVVFYGSSITQGGCASKPGNCYQGFISRALNCNYINLGFNGSARGEDVMADFIAEHEMSAFVYDYDHNAPDIEHLRATHKKFFDRIRAKHKDLPIIMMSKPGYDKNKSDSIQRRDAIYQTYIDAVNDGDKNVYFIDGYSLFLGDERDACTVDGVHPNDLGFYRMAKPVTRLLQEVLR